MPLTVRKREYFCITWNRQRTNLTITYLEMTILQRENMPISTTAFLGRRSLGLLRYCFPHGPIRIKNIFHDTEGNLQDHEYFDWHVIQQASKEEPRVQFTRDKVVLRPFRPQA